MEHKAHVENIKYRNWVKAGLGLKYVKECLEPFCDHLVNQQHIEILVKVKQKHSLSSVSCGLCDVRTLQPNHVQTKTRQCPLGQRFCNCQNPRGKIACPNSVCGAIYDEIIQLHASTPPAPNWRNTDAHQWCNEPWAVAKCFINAPGYDEKIRAVEFDCPGLLHILINNIDFQQHIKCVITGADVFSRVRMFRNEIVHSNTMELEDAEVNSYIDDMIELLEDEKEIKHRQESKDAIRNLLELKQNDFIISTTDEAEIRRVAMTAINEKEIELQQTIDDAKNELRTKSAEGQHDIDRKGLSIQSDLKETGKKIRNELLITGDEIKSTADECKRKLEKEGLVIKTSLEETGKRLEQKGIELENKLVMKNAEAEVNLEQKPQEAKLEFECKQKVILDNLEQKYSSETGLESGTKNMTDESMTSNTEVRQEAEESRKKAEFQEKLVKRYEKYVRRVSLLPRQPKRHQRNVSDVYVPPWLTVEKKNEDTNGWEEVQIFMHEIFKNKEKPAKYIYVIGEAGSGKSTFCKMLVHFWCIAHQFQDCSLDESDLVKEMNSFKFLFFVSLRHCSDCGSIEEMLEKSYRDPTLRDILQNDSDKCLIVLDGLDEWNPDKKHHSQFLTPGLPGRELDADYTIITTSRQWKFDALSISDSEVDKKVKLNGIDEYEMKNLTEKTVKMLNDSFQESKSAEMCKIDLQSRHVSEISHTPLILQQLISLWFDDKLRDNSKYAIYSSMLALFLDWKTFKTTENQQCEIIAPERTTDSPLPDYLCDFQTFRENTFVIQYLSHLAYETLFDKNKEIRLAFSYLVLNRLNIPHDVIKNCLHVGILKEEQSVSLHASVRQQSSFSFFHKSMQEYLAAVYVASKFKEMLTSRKSLQNDENDLTEICREFVGKYFGSCKTAVDILEQSNVLMMLCGLEPRLLTNVSEYIYNVTLVDETIIEERNKAQTQYSLDHHKFIRDIQTCIFKCTEEVVSSAKNVNSPVYISDLYVFRSTDLLRYIQYITLKTVLSIEVTDDGLSIIERGTKTFSLAVEYLTICDHLKAVKARISDERLYRKVAQILETNVSTLETISLLNIDKRMILFLVLIIPKMRRLTTLQLNSSANVSQDVCLSLCTMLNQTASLQHISLGITCEKNKQHQLDLSNHTHIQYVDFMFCTFYMGSCNTDNLETCKLDIISGAMMNQACTTLYKACKLKHLEPNGAVSLMFNYIECRIITESLIRLLPSLISLSTLTLWDFYFTDNIIACPSDMKNLKEITLISVAMSMKTWYKFIDCLPELPQVVKVEISNMDIRGGTIYDKETILGYVMRDKSQEADARAYVREKTNLFRVTSDSYLLFCFTAKKS
ncbi:uncharacterized protein LOC128552861 [Mercenaria mercenaria]|uniref:uncharacterized protein LOC128552861 n=1 Tax=Mercenaria mercenaria TaxID=6596 RepID=UPI00234E887D|nr:uncharacterized protein LOC128552861 [Mercenaria mercenaria]